MFLSDISLDFFQVFPYEYQRALKQLKEKESVKEEAPEPKDEEEAKAPIKDIEDTIPDVTMDKLKVEKLLDKTR